MAEDPTKLFATHAERYPQSNELDATRTALEKVVEMVPVLGPITVHMIAHFLAPGVERRREEWFKELADGLDRLRETKECFNVESLAQSETFVSAAIQATRIAIATHQFASSLFGVGSGEGVMNWEAARRPPSADRVIHLAVNFDEVSSSEIRGRIASAQPWQHLAAPEIADTIAEIYTPR